MRRRKPVVLRSASLLLLTAGTVIGYAAGWHSPVRVVVALSFMLFVPGWALVELLAIRDPLHQLMLATSVSIALETAVGLILLYAGAFTITNSLAVVASLTILVIAATLVRETA